MTSLKGLIIMILSSYIDIARKRLYVNQINFNDFTNIDEEELKRIKDLVKKTKETIFSQSTNANIMNEKLEQYLAVMRYLGSTNTNNDLPTYDAKIVFLIEAIDPDLELYKTYLEYPIILMSQIAYEDNLAKKLELQSKANNQMKKVESKIRQKSGFYDAKLLNYEAKYFKTIRCHNELLTTVNHAYFAKFSQIFKESSKFAEITMRDNEELILKAEDYLDKYGANINTLAFQLLFQPEILGLDTIDKIIIFFILVIDKDLKLLDICNEEANWKEIQKRALEEMGFYSKELVILEKKYQEMFVPDYVSWENKEKLKQYD